MLFHASAPLLTRHGDPFREAKPGEKPNREGKFEDSQMRELRHGDVAMLALDTALEGDDKVMKDDLAKWVRAVMRREAISRAISTAMLTGDGWTTLQPEQAELLIDRLALLVPRTGVGMVGQVMLVLEKPPAERPEPTTSKANGRSKGEARPS